MQEPFNLEQLPGLRNKHQVFADREDAGGVLGRMLAPRYKGRGGLVLTIPSGGVPVGAALASALGVGLDMIVVRKLQIPGNTEAGFGAMALDGRIWLNPDLTARLNLSESDIEAEKSKVAAELEKRNQVFRQGRPLPEAKGETVFLVDDGLASGYTMLAALQTVAAMKPAGVIIAVPTAPMSSILRVHEHAHQIFCANVQDYGPFAVASAYREWRDLDEDDVLEVLRGFESGGSE